MAYDKKLEDKRYTAGVNLSLYSSNPTYGLKCEPYDRAVDFELQEVQRFVAIFPRRSQLKKKGYSRYR